MHHQPMKRNSLLLILILTFFSLSHAATFTVNSNADTDDGTSITPFTLRKCIRLANATAGATSASPHVINFTGFSGTITLTSNLPIFTTPIFIDGSTSLGYTARVIGGITTRTPGTAGTFGTPAIPTITLSGFSIFQNNVAASGSRFKGLAITNANPHGFDIQGVNNITIEECNIGINAAGTIIAASAAHGILLNVCSGTIIKNNILSGNVHAILSLGSSNMYIFGNFIGCNRAGTAAIPNTAFGMLLLDNSSNVRIGGLTSDSSNLISGNNQSGIGLQGSAKSNIKIINNYIGVTKAGTAALSNQFGINDAGNVTTLIIQNNVVSASTSQGIYCYLTSGLVLKGNYVGTDVTGMSTIYNGSNGIDLNETHGAIIGGTTASDRNVISGTDSPGEHGIVLQGGARTNNCIIKGNYIGTNAQGRAITGGNLGYGIVIKGSNNILGGTAAGEANIISGNDHGGVLLTDGSNNKVYGNLIGVDFDLNAYGNGYGGVFIRREDASFPTINNEVKYNTIAYNGYTYPTNPTNATWVAPGKGPGIAVSVAEYGTSNTDAIQHSLSRNKIYCNAYKGIDINKLETTPGYGNINKATPVINKPASSNTFTTGTAGANDSIEVYANPTSSCGCQAEVFLGKTKADAAGVFSLTHASANYLYITVISRDASNNTSEISNCRVALPVQFVSINAELYKPGTSKITWSTATEANNEFFTIEKSMDGVNFYSIGTVAAVGNSTDIINYTFQDLNFVENAYYRIRQTDFDGKTGTSSMVFLKNNIIGNFSIYPNPSSDKITINGPVDKGVITITLYNNLSQVILYESYFSESDFFSRQVNINSLPPGVYHIMIVSDSDSFTDKIIKQ
jgi:hypothetical protein